MKFSVITATKDRPGWMPRAMISVLAQTHTDWEHIILDGSREPGLFQVPNDPRVRYIYQPNSGPAEAFQLAPDQVTGGVVQPPSPWGAPNTRSRSASRTCSTCTRTGKAPTHTSGPGTNRNRPPGSFSGRG